MGERLRDFVKDAGWAQYELKIADAIAENRPIFVTIRSSAAELYALPWELLKLKSGQFIGGIDSLLLRFEWPESITAPETPPQLPPLPQLPPRPAGGRILFAWSAAAGPVPDKEHLDALVAACAAGFHPFHTDQATRPAGTSGRGLKAAADVLAHASLANIVKTLAAAQEAKAPIAVLHLLCHGASAGSSCGLALDGQDGPVVVDAAELRQQLAPFRGMVRLIVLSACNSGNPGALGSQLGSVAQELHREGFAAVVASRYPLSVAGSITLTERFYHELLAGPASVESAFVAARAQLLRNEPDLPRERRPLDWASLQFYSRHGDGDDTRPVVFQPYRGLLAFQPEHRRFFFGHDVAWQKVLSALQALVVQAKPRFLVVAGASGTGKSSLVFAGAVPKLLEANPQLAFLQMRPGSDPEQALDAALAGLPPGAPALLVVDQFEEVFTQTTAPAVRQSFARRLWSLACAPAPAVCVIVTLRIDFIGRCGELVVDADGLRLDLVAYDKMHGVLLAQLQPEQLRAAIVNPAHKVGLELQEGLVDRMLQEVGSAPSALPLLEYALDALWQQREGRLLTQVAYQNLGGVIGALQKRADDIVNQLSNEDLGIAERLLVSLVGFVDEMTLDSRLRISRDELAHTFSAAEAAGFERVLEALVAARLLVQDGNKENSPVEVAHEALIRKWPRLLTWLANNREGLLNQRRVKQAAQQWELQKRDESLLYRGAQLARCNEWRTSWKSQLGDLEQQFLAASAALKARLENQEAERQRREREAEAALAAEKLQRERQSWAAAALLKSEQQQKEQQRQEAAQKLYQRTRLAALVLAALGLAAIAIGIRASQKSAEAHDSLVSAAAQYSQDDATVAATILREAGHREGTLWTQLAVNALHAGVAKTVLRGHAAQVLAAAFSPDGKRVVTGSADNTARSVTLDGSSAPVVLKGHTEPIYSVAFSPDGKKVVTGSADHTARIWNADGKGNIVVLTGHGSGVYSVAFSPDGKRVVTGSWDHTARIWSTDGIALRTLAKHTDAVYCAAFSPDGKKVVTGSWDKTALIWDADTATVVGKLDQHQQGVTAVAFSPDGKKVVTGSNDYTGLLWNVDTNKVSSELRGHQERITSVAFSPDGKEIITASWDNTARIWNTDDTSVPLGLLRHRTFVASAAFSPDGKDIITASWDNTARIWSADDQGEPRLFKGHRDVVTSVAFSADGKKIVSGSADHTARIWNADGTGEPIVITGHADKVTSVAFSPDGKKVVTGSADNLARIWNGDGTGEPIPFPGHQGGVSAVAFSPDGTQIATGCADDFARIWNADGNSQPVLIAGHHGGIGAVAFSPDGEKIVTGCGDSIARIWRVDGTGNQVPLAGHQGSVLSAVFSADGKRVATGSMDQTARIWNADGKGEPVILRDHLAKIFSVAFRADGKRVVTGSWDTTVRVWPVDDSGPPLVLKGSDSHVYAVAFSPDGKKVVTGSDDNIVRVWTVDSEVLLSALWAATTDCLPVERRQQLLGESFATATTANARCQHEVRRRQHAGAANR